MVERIPQNEDASSMIVAPRFNISIGHQEYSKNDDHNVPTREDQTSMVVVGTRTLIRNEQLT